MKLIKDLSVLDDIKVYLYNYNVIWSGKIFYEAMRLGFDWKIPDNIHDVISLTNKKLYIVSFKYISFVHNNNYYIILSNKNFVKWRSKLMKYPINVILVKPNEVSRQDPEKISHSDLQKLSEAVRSYISKNDR